MTRKRSADSRRQFEFYMDLLGHDIMNSNQAVLSYLELIISSPGADRKVKALAEKAIQHVRTSTLLIENVKRLMAARSIDPDSLKPIDVVSALRDAEGRVGRHFPSKKISFEIPSEPAKAMALGEELAQDLIFNVLVTAVRLNPGNDVRLTMSLSPGEAAGRPVWVLRVEDNEAKLPPFLDGEGVEATYAQDISVAVKTTGILFAKMMAKSIGGDFEAHALSKEPGQPGAAYTVTFRRAVGR